MVRPVDPLKPGPLPLAGGMVEIVAALGRVGDGLVYRARAEGRAVRLREYAPAGIVQRLDDGRLEPTDPSFAAAWDAACASFLRQGARLGDVDHYAVAPMFRASARDGQGACSIGAPVGESLARALAAGLVLPPGEVMRLACDLADALALLHARGILHLDIAPATVSIAVGWLELADFAVDNRPFVSLLGTQEGLIRPGYSPIEHSDAAMAEPLGPPADVHAASALLFRLVTGREPALWQARWRDPAGTALPDLPGYPPAFLAAIRKGLEIEPGNRFADGAAWRDALQLPPVDEALHGRTTRRLELPSPVRAPEPAPGPRRRWLLFVVIAAALLLLALLAYLAYSQRWFAPKPTPAADQPINGVAPAQPAPVQPPPPPPPANEVPVLQIGGGAEGRLEESDRRRGSGQHEDRYALNARGGERVVIRLRSDDFDPMLFVTGPDFAESNDDAGLIDRDSELEVTFPITGRYVIAVTSYDRDETGAYSLTVERAEEEPAEEPL